MFTRRMTEMEEQALYDTAEEVAEVLDKLGFPWWLSHGTLYGSYVFHGVMPWDDDLDIAFPRDHIDVIERFARENGWGFIRHHPFSAKIWNPERAVTHTHPGWSWPFVDLALYDLFPIHRYILVEYKNMVSYGVFQEKDLLPTRPYHFGPLMLPIPKNTELYMDTVYAPWRTMACSSNYCHRTETLYPEPSIWRSNEELMKEFPMYNIPPALPNKKEAG